MKRSIHQGILMLIMYAFKIYKAETDRTEIEINSKILVRNFNPPLSAVDRISGQDMI